MGKYDISKMADSNSDYLRDQYDLLRQRYEDQSNLPVLDAFVKLIEKEWTISVNMSLESIHDFLFYGSYDSILDYYRRTEDIFDIKLDHIKALEIRLKGYMPKRIAFNNCFNDSERFKYGALNIGGLGAMKYGKFCVILKKARVEGYTSLVFIKEDSLNEYVDNRHDVDFGRLSKEIANKEHVHLLAALKHHGIIDTIPENRWAQIICCNKEYIESIIQEDITGDHIETIRISKIENNRMYKILFDINFKKSKSKIRTEVYRKAFKLYKDVKSLIKQKGIRLEVVNER